MTALDFSYARPGSAALNAAGVTSVGRYLATDGRGITLAEFNDYTSRGISVWFIKENAARGMLNGYGQGVADAQWAENQMNALGVSGAPIYFTADFDVLSSQFPACDAYLNGAASVIGLARVGIYAGLHYLNHAVNLASYYWKTAANSWDHGETATIQLHLTQTLDAVPIPGTDYNIIGRPYHGQVTSAGVADLSGTQIGENDMTPDEHNLLVNISAALFGGGPSMPDGGKGLGQSVAEIHNSLAATVGRTVNGAQVNISQIDDNAQTGTLVRQILAIPEGTGTAIDYNLLAATILTALKNKL